MSDWFLDAGYPRDKQTGELVHRRVAREHLYEPSKDEYPLPFGAYQVHHKDRNKRNFHPDNLEIVTALQHDERHGRYQKRVGIAAGGMLAGGGVMAALLHAGALGPFWVALVATGGFGSYLYTAVMERRADLPRRRR